MTDEQLDEWKACVTTTLNTICDLDLNILPVYIESRSIYGYPFTFDDETFDVYDIPLKDIWDYTEDTAKLVQELKWISNDSEHSMILRNKTADTEEDSISMMIPQSLCAIINFDEKTGILFDNNINHMGNPLVRNLLETLADCLKSSYDQITGTDT